MTAYAALREQVVVTWASLASYAAAVAATDSPPQLLDEDEAARWYGYRRREDRDRFALGAVLVRAVVARQMGTSEGAVRLMRDCPRCRRPHGRVRVPDGPEVSVAHAGGWVGVAVSRQSVGLDVEPLMSQSHQEAVFAAGLDEHEREAHLSLDPDRRPASLLRTWVRKEAVLKCTGDGLMVDPRDVRLADPGEQPRVVAWASRPDAASELWVLDLLGAPGHIAALAGRGPALPEVVEELGDDLVDGLIRSGAEAGVRW